jgi:uncharacterized protein
MDLALIYASVPRIRCAGKCQASCGPIDAGPAEKRAFESVTGKPFPNKFIVLGTRDATCPLLNVIGQCSVYPNRPLICRLWGVVDGMPCHWGCVPERPMSDGEASQLFREIAAHRDLKWIYIDEYSASEPRSPEAKRFAIWR